MLRSKAALSAFQICELRTIQQRLVCEAVGAAQFQANEAAERAAAAQRRRRL